jgi:rhodanese-related sulfurtransferase
MPASPHPIDATALKAALHDGGEIALLDAREEVPFDARHILMAACVPLSRLEFILNASVPRRGTRVVWCDDGEGLAQRAAARMIALGWHDVSVLAGGITAWATAGHPLYEGVHVPSKAFAEVVEHEANTPWITAEDLKRMIDAQENIALFDSRSYAEFHENSIPTAISVPGGELVYRFDDLVTSPDTLVVVNCGGRTRSIIGAQALINAGVPNRVVSLRNGTQDWHLAGYEVLRGRTARMPSVSPSGHGTARARAAAMAERFGVPRIDAATLTAWRAEAETRTLYVFDVRDPEEYESGHIPGMKHVAGGQLVQETDRHAATWGARIVCVDDDGVRAVVTAHWLIQMGWEAAALTLDHSALTGATGPWQPTVLGFGDPVPTITAAELHQRLERQDSVVIDLDWSRSYRAGHIPGAWYGIRSRLDTILPSLPSGRTVVVTSSDGALARLAAREHSVLALEGGTRAWVAAGLPMETGATRMASPPDDMRLRAREQEGGVEAAMRAYLTWEINLAAQMAADTDHRFRIQRG